MTKHGGWLSGWCVCGGYLQGHLVFHGGGAVMPSGCFSVLSYIVPESFLSKYMSLGGCHKSSGNNPPPAPRLTHSALVLLSNAE